MIKLNPIKALCLSAAVLLVGCAGSKPSNIGISGGQLVPCPSTPNCVSSYAKENDDAYITPLQQNQDTWQQLRALITETSNATITQQTPIYIHAEYASDLMGFVDDVEFKKADQVIHVRSASRLGYSDLGVNRERIETIRQQLDQ